MGTTAWVYIIISIVVFIVRQMKKSAKNTPPTSARPQGESSYESQDTGKKAMTFEELLREIQESKTPPQPTKPVAEYKPVKSYEVDYDDDLKEESKNLETIPSSNKRSLDEDNRSNELYEKAKREAFNKPSLEETMKLQDTVMKYSHFKEYDDSSKRSVAKEVLEDFKDPEGFKKAFIMSEILKRKF